MTQFQEFEIHWTEKTSTIDRGGIFQHHDILILLCLNENKLFTQSYKRLDLEWCTQNIGIFNCLSFKENLFKSLKGKYVFSFMNHSIFRNNS